MDGKKNPPRIKDSDLDEIRANMGGRMDRAELTGQNPHNPQRGPAPQRPGTPKQPEGGIRPIVPLIPDGELAAYEKWTRENPEQQVVFGNNQHGKIDKDLNEFALAEIAKERGITVEELLSQNPDKALEQKVEFADVNEKTMSIEEAKRIAAEGVKQAVQGTVGESDMSEEEIKLQLEELELRKKLAQAQRSKAQQAPPPPKAKAKAPPIRPKAPKKKSTPGKVHPLLKKLRQEFALDAIKPVEIVVNDIKFSMTPPPGSLQTWSMEKIAAAGQVGSEQAMIATIRNVVVATALVMIEDVSIAEIFSLTSEEIKDPLRLSADLRVLMAQTIWEMIHGDTTIEGAFSLDPEVVLMLYTGYDKAFGKSRFHVEGEALHRYTCPIPDCEEMYEITVPEDGNLFCKRHAVPMEDHGLVEELDQLPLS